MNSDPTLNPLVTVIIPTYNRAQCLARAIESVLQQQYAPVELLVIDDGSTDHTAEVVARYPSAVYVYKKNGRQASARNAGLERARGRYIATLDSDDCWDPNFLSTCVPVMEHRVLYFVFTNRFDVKLDGTIRNQSGAWQNFGFLSAILNKPAVEYSNWYFPAYEAVRTLFIQTCPAPSSALVFRKSFISRAWDEKLIIADDWEFTIGLLLSKPCNTGICTIPLWTKHQIGDNVYESKTNMELVKQLHYHDCGYILQKHGANLLPEERAIIRKRQLEQCFAMSRTQFYKKSFGTSIQMLGYSFQLDTLQTLRKLRQRNYGRLLRKTLHKVRNKISL